MSGSSLGQGLLRRAGERFLAWPRAVSWLPATAWYGCIWLLSSRHGSTEPTHWIFYVLSNGAHAPLFGVMAAFLALLAPRRDGWPDLAWPMQRRLVLAILALGMLDELHQSVTPGRDFSVLDVLTDVTGALLTLWILAAIGRPRAGVAWRFALAAAVTFGCGAIATFAPRCFPGLDWL